MIGRLGYISRGCSFLQSRVSLLNTLMNFSSVDNVITKKIFDKFDMNRDGKIDLNDLKQSIQDKFSHFSDLQYKMALGKIDKSNKGHASFEDFTAYFKTLELPTEKEMKKTFDAMDLNKDGKITWDEMAKSTSEFLFNDEGLTKEAKKELGESTAKLGFMLVGKKKGELFDWEDHKMSAYFGAVIGALMDRKA